MPSRRSRRSSGPGRCGSDPMRLEPNQVRYIKLGPGGGWWPVCRDRAEIHFGFTDEPHDEAASGDWDAVWKRWFEIRGDRTKASNDTREIRDFYSLGENDLWVTIEEGYLWWAFAGREMFLTDGETATYGARYRKLIGKWSNQSLGGRSLTIRNISGKLTMLAGYRRTICSVREKDYLLRLLNDDRDPDVLAAIEAEQEFALRLYRLIQKLTWQDFEILTDLMFARAGWRRATELGRHQKSIDLELEHPATSERAVVQVKSAAGQQALDDFALACEPRHDVRHIFFVCHSPFMPLKPAPVAPHQRLHVWSMMSLSTAVLESGLARWVQDRCA